MITHSYFFCSFNMALMLILGFIQPILLRVGRYRVANGQVRSG